MLTFKDKELPLWRVILIVLSVLLIMGGALTVINKNSNSDKASPKVAAPQKQEKVVVRLDPNLKTKINKGPAPSKLAIPALKVKAPVDRITLAKNGDLIPPDNALRLGWWNGSSKPGSQIGQMVVTGHVLHNTKNAALEPLKRIAIDSDILVRGGNKLYKYRVTKIEKIVNTRVQNRQQELFGQSNRTRGRLVLITCSDWNGKYYETNLFVFADLVK